MDAAFRRGYGPAAAELESKLQPGADTGRLNADLWAVAQLLQANPVLRRNLADPSREGADKKALAGRLLRGKIGDDALDVVRTVAAQRWTADGDIITAVERLAVEVALGQAEIAGRLASVQDELFRFERIVAADTDLQSALTDRRADLSAKLTVVDRLLGARTTPETVILARQAVTGLRSQRFDRVIRTYLEQAAARQEQVTATVTTAVPLSPEHEERLVRTLSAQYGRAVHTNIVIDESVVGGIRVDIGDEVIDGTISHRLSDARRRLSQ